MLCSPVIRFSIPDGEESFFYELDSPEAKPPSPKTLMERVVGAKPAYHLLESAADWSRVEKDALRSQATVHAVIKAQGEFVYALCSVKHLRFSRKLCVSKVETANQEKTASAFLQAVLKVRQTVAQLVSFDPSCYRRGDFDNLCEKETIIINLYLEGIPSLAKEGSLPSTPPFPEGGSYMPYALPLSVKSLKVTELEEGDISECVGPLMLCRVSLTISEYQKNSLVRV